MTKKKLELIIGWLYPDLMSTYGDRGNIICLKKRCLWRGIDVDVVSVEQNTTNGVLEKCNLIVGGGAQDRQQEIVMKDLRKKRGVLKAMFGEGIPGLFVCGSPQLLGHYYMTGSGKKLKGLGIFDFVTKHSGYKKPRCIGNTVAVVNSEFRIQSSEFERTIVGFENHGGRTYLGKKVKPFAKVLVGFGNNGEDGFEGAVFQNAIACYYHGPFLPKNPHIADWLLAKALEIKYKKKISLKALDDTLERQAHEFMLKRLKVKLWKTRQK